MDRTRPRGEPRVDFARGISIALIEIALGVLGGNLVGLQTTPWIDLSAAIGAILLTFLAGAEIDPVSLRRQLRPRLATGGISFAAPAVSVFLVAYVALGWSDAGPLPLPRGAERLRVRSYGCRLHPGGVDLLFERRRECIGGHPPVTFA